MGFLKELKYQHNSHLSPSRIGDIYAPQEQWLYTWKGYSWKTCTVQKKILGSKYCLSSHSHAVLWEWLPDLPRTVLLILSADQNTDPHDTDPLVPNFSSIYRHACTAQSNSTAGRPEGRFSAYANHQNSLHFRSTL